MKKLLIIIPMIALALFAAPLAFANNGGDKGRDNDDASEVKVAANAGFWPGLRDRKDWDLNNWPCMHPGWGRFFARGWLKTHGDKCATNDTQDPTISDIGVSSITRSSAVITATADESVSMYVEYGTNDNYGKTVSKTDFKKTQVLKIEDLSADTTYHYRVTIRDMAGNTAKSNDRTFTTNDIPNNDDTTRPVISNIDIANTTGTSVRITWNTDERATSRIYYAADRPLIIGGVRIVSDATLRTSHDMTINNLSANTTYYFIVESVDANGNIRVSAEQSVTTD